MNPAIFAGRIYAIGGGPVEDEDYLLAVGTQLTPYLTFYNTKTWEKVYPISAGQRPTSSVRDCAFSHDGKYFAVATTSSPYLYFYKINKDADWERLPTPSFSGSFLTLDFSQDSLFLVIGRGATPTVQFLLVPSLATVNTPSVFPSTPPTTMVRYSKALGNKQILTVANDASPYLYLYDSSYNRIYPASNPPTYVDHISMDDEAKYIAVSFAGSPRFWLYDTNGFVKKPNPSVLPTSNGYAVLSSDGTRLFFKEPTRVRIYDTSDMSYLGEVPTIGGYDYTTKCDSSHEGKYLAFSNNGLQHLIIHDRDLSYGKSDNPPTQPMDLSSTCLVSRFQDPNQKHNFKFDEMLVIVGRESSTRSLYFFDPQTLTQIRKADLSQTTGPTVVLESASKTNLVYVGYSTGVATIQTSIDDPNGRLATNFISANNLSSGPRKKYSVGVVNGRFHLIVTPNNANPTIYRRQVTTFTTFTHGITGIYDAAKFSIDGNYLALFYWPDREVRIFRTSDWTLILTDVMNSNIYEYYDFHFSLDSKKFCYLYAITTSELIGDRLIRTIDIETNSSFDTVVSEFFTIYAGSPRRSNPLRFLIDMDGNFVVPDFYWSEVNTVKYRGLAKYIPGTSTKIELIELLGDIQPDYLVFNRDCTKLIVVSSFEYMTMFEYPSFEIIHHIEYGEESSYKFTVPENIIFSGGDEPIGGF